MHLLEIVKQYNYPYYYWINFVVNNVNHYFDESCDKLIQYIMYTWKYISKVDQIEFENIQR